MRFLLPLLFLVGCAYPDEVSVSPYFGQYDYFASTGGSTNEWPFTNDTGNSYGVGLEVTWFLKPREMTFVTPQRHVDPFESKKDPSPIIINPSNPEKKDESFGKQAREIIDATKGMTAEQLLFWAFTIFMSAVVVSWITPKILIYMNLKKKKD